MAQGRVRAANQRAVRRPPTVIEEVGDVRTPQALTAVALLGLAVTALSCRPEMAARPGGVEEKAGFTGSTAGGAIAFTRSARDPRDISPPSIWLMAADGSHQTRLTTNDCDWSPAWSPNGDRIAFTRGPVGGGAMASVGGVASDVVTINADGGGLLNLTDDLRADCYAPSWSPDGRLIAFVRQTLLSDGSFGSEIFVMHADGTGKTNLTNGRGYERWSSWSPDGSKIAFVRGQYGGDLFVMSADGTEPTRVTHEGWDAGIASGQVQGPAAWSPDGRTIAFAVQEGGDAPPAVGVIHVLAVEGRQQTQLTDSSDYCFHPAWSPDGSKIVYFRERPPSPGQIYVMNADGTEQRPLTQGAFSDREPSWWGPAAPDAAALTTNAPRGGTTP